MGEGADGARTGGIVGWFAGVVTRLFRRRQSAVKLLYTLGEWSPAAPKKRGV